MHDRREPSLPPRSRLYIDFDDVADIGEGSFGRVYQACNITDRKLYAIKSIQFSSISCSDEKLTSEVKILSGMEHENVLRYYTSWIEPPCPGPVGDGKTLSSFTGCSVNPYMTNLDEGGKLDRTVFIQTELYGNEDLRQCFHELVENPEQISKLFHDIVKGMAYIHNKGIAHGDLYKRNIFISRDGDNIKAVIGDFGLSISQFGSQGENFELKRRNDITGVGDILLEILMHRTGRQFEDLIELDISSLSDEQLKRHVLCLKRIFSGDNRLLTTASQLLEILESENYNIEPKHIETCTPSETETCASTFPTSVVVAAFGLGVVNVVTGWLMSGKKKH